MKKEYHKHIVSTPEHQVWLHRTHRGTVDTILKNGLRISDNIASTATHQPEDFTAAEKKYRASHKGADSVIVVKIPMEVVNRHFDTEGARRSFNPTRYSEDKELTYVDSEGEFTLQRKYVHGWIDRETDIYTPNPYLNEQQKLTDEHFPPGFYGGLEEDVLKSEKVPRDEMSQEEMRATMPPPETFLP